MRKRRHFLAFFLPVHFVHRQYEAANHGLRMLDLSGTCLEDKDLYIERTLVSAGERNIVLVRILNACDKTQIIGA